MPTLLIKYPDGSEHEEDLATELTIGRAEGNDLMLAEGGVSRRHARLFLEGEQVMVEDTGSANGTWVDGARIEGPTALGPKNQLVIGEYELKVKSNGKNGARGAPGRASPRESFNPDDSARPTSLRVPVRAARATKVVQAVKPDPGSKLAVRPPAKAQGVAGPTLRGLAGPWVTRVFPLAGTKVVGRVAGTDIQLDDDSVSRRHAELEVRVDGVVVRDLGSANGTSVNGEPVESETQLTSGDVLQFGVIEMMFEAPEPAGRPRVARGKKGGPVGGPGTKRTRLFVAVGAVVLLVAAGGIIKVLTATPAKPDPVLTKSLGPEPVEPEGKLQEHLSACRSFANREAERPDWGKAEAACIKALDIEPIHPEANALIRQIHIEKEAQEFFEQGEKAMLRLREEEALQSFQKIPKESYYYFRVLPKIADAKERVQKRALEECRRYFADGHFEEAARRCEVYMSYACQTMRDEELEEPPGFTLTLDAPNPRKKLWRPKNEDYVRFLRARQKSDPGAPRWKCKRTDTGAAELFREKVADPDKEVRKWADTLFQQKDVRDAMILYWAGRSNEANNLLLKVRENRDLAQYHMQAEDLRKDVNTVAQLYAEGSGQLGSDRCDKAQPAFREALDVDKKLMREQFERFPSFYRRNIQQDMASNCYQTGKGWADRMDYRQACRFWKIGFQFYKGNPDLLRALSNVCTTLAIKELDQARSCDALRRVEDLAVDGDGIKEQVEARRTEWNCK